MTLNKTALRVESVVSIRTAEVAAAEGSLRRVSAGRIARLAALAAEGPSRGLSSFNCFPKKLSNDANILRLGHSESANIVFKFFVDLKKLWRVLKVSVYSRARNCRVYTLTCFSGPEVVTSALKHYMLIGIRPRGLVIHA